MTDRNTFIVKVEKHLFDDLDQLAEIFTPAQLDRLIMYRDIYTHWLAHPEKHEGQIAKSLISKYGRSQSQAYIDAGNIKKLLGNVSMAKKEFERYAAIKMTKEAYKLAKNAKDRLDVARAEAMAKAAKVLGEVNRLNKMDPQEIPYEEIIPPEFEPVYDVTLLNKPTDIDVEKQTKKLKKKYGIIDDKAEEAEIIEDE